jgi:hypothetical protein
MDYARILHYYLYPMPRSLSQITRDFLTFPMRAFLLVEGDKWGLSALPTERFDYVSRQVQGYCLDVGCGKYNRFVKEFLDGEGVGIDVYKYDGLTDENIVGTSPPFPSRMRLSRPSLSSPTSTMCPSQCATRSLLKHSGAEAGGNIVVTMGNPVAMVMTHR